ALTGPVAWGIGTARGCVGLSRTRVKYTADCPRHPAPAPGSSCVVGAPAPPAQRLGSSRIAYTYCQGTRACLRCVVSPVARGSFAILRQEALGALHRGERFGEHIPSIADLQRSRCRYVADEK